MKYVYNKIYRKYVLFLAVKLYFTSKHAKNVDN